MRAVAAAVCAALVLGAFALWLNSGGSTRDVGIPPNSLPVQPQEATHERTGAAGEPRGAASISVRIVDSLRKSPIPGATLEFVIESGVQGSVNSDFEGTAVLPAAGMMRLRMHASGYATVERNTRVSDHDQFELAPVSAALCIRFADERGNPVSGVEVRLVPPNAMLAMETHPGGRRDSLVRESDDAGSAEWYGLPPGEGYRWSVLSEHSVVLEPKGPPIAEATERGFEVTSSSTGSLSGPIALVAGAIREIDALVFRQTSIIGRVAVVEAASAAAVVKLFHRSRVDHETGSALVSYDIERWTRASQNGTFEFKGVAPGQKRIFAYWRNSPSDVYIASLECAIEAGEHKNIGTLAPREGFSMAITVGLADPDGNALGAEAVFGPLAEKPTAVLSIHMSPESQDVEQLFAEKIGVRLGERITLHGLPEGICRLRAEQEPNWPRPARGTMTIREPDEVVIGIPAAQDTALNLIVQESIQATVVLEFPPETIGVCFETDVYARSERTGTIRRARAPMPRAAFGGEPIECTINLPAGTYELLAHTGVFGSETSDLSLSARGTLAVNASSRAAKLVLTPAVTLNGVLLDERGNADVKGIAFASPAEWHVRVSPYWTYKARTNEDGRFSMRGLPPGGRILVSGCSEPITLPSSSGVFEAEIRRHGSE